MAQYEKYRHWDGHPQVWVRNDLKGRHREHCLCYSCEHFKPEDREANCRIANLMFSVCVALGITTPVWECPEFKER